MASVVRLCSMLAELCICLHLSQQAVIRLSRFIYQAQARFCSSAKFKHGVVAFAVQRRVLGYSSLTHLSAPSARSAVRLVAARGRPVL